MTAMHDTLARHRDRLFGTDESFAAETLRALGRGTNPALAEKSTHALEYVAQLKVQGMAFVFGGGTAAQLLLADGISRLSKDVDVIAPEGSPDDWRRAVAAISERFGGAVYQATEEQRDHGGFAIPAIHFLIAYPTVFPSKAVAGGPLGDRAGRGPRAGALPDAGDAAGHPLLHDERAGGGDDADGRGALVGWCAGGTG